MNTNTLPKLVQEEEQKLILQGISWQEYLALDSTLENVPGVRLSYLTGTLQIMTLSPQHEAVKTTIGRLLEMYAFAKNIALHGYGSTTYRRELKASGLEPDECYFIGEIKDVPDLAIEVVITSGGINKLAIYQGLGVREVWFWESGNFSLYNLGENEYQSVSRSQFFPDLDLAVLSQYVQPFNQPQAVRDFYTAVCQ
ncbi:MAG: Uma2 family endonuclease [Gomphosphaeria aponina SAG 52.96 = DSM 107014]|uniref:Uma2 family endonuclease n=1 Tax=Gomphosphaeria aponina SAG 52.96 = DSM 107014 TaxID=1521640 RepID=A0A941GTT7_9CHRO|nr:Uma2 family endonuclease [Gomphosphaeria aponina SAG 52.96 = DSM 107014]